MRQCRVAVAILVAVAAAVFSRSTVAETLLERGEYLVRVMAACGNCHTPFTENGPDMSRELAGRFLIKMDEFTAYPPNITQDRETGIGSWTDEQIKRAIREGIRPNGTIIGPPMPIALYRGLSDTDLNAMVAFLRTVKPVNNKEPPTLYNIPLPPSYGPPVEDVPDVPRGPTVEYGRYLAGPVAHCIECHSTPGPMGPDWVNALGAGGQAFEGPWGISVAPNITPHADGIAKYTDADLKAIITTGRRPDGSEMYPPMGYGFYAKMQPDDLTAIIKYLRSLPPLPNP
jgi:mono/diheme cytochrome c family protein